jgi:hypothetical protein
LNEKTHCDMQAYLSVEHDIIRNVQYKGSFEYVEDLINIKFNMNQVLRLMILLSKTNDGLSISDYNYLTNLFLQVYFNFLYL